MLIFLKEYVVSEIVKVFYEVIMHTMHLKSI